MGKKSSICFPFSQKVKIPAQHSWFLYLKNFGVIYVQSFLVFHRILDFKTGLDFYLRSLFFCPYPRALVVS